MLSRAAIWCVWWCAIPRARLPLKTAPYKFRKLEVLYEESWVGDLGCNDWRRLRPGHVARRKFHGGARASHANASHARPVNPAAAGCRCAIGFTGNGLQGTNQIGAGGFNCYG